MLLDPRTIREIAAEIGLRPTKARGQNFVHDANTVRRIVAAAGVGDGDRVLEVGPGLGSLTLGLLEAGARVTAVEIEPVLASRLPQTVAALAPEAAERLRVVTADALRVAFGVADGVRDQPNAMVANLPYNVSVPVLLRLLADVPTIERGLVMVQAEVADRLVAAPGSKVYGSPSVKMAWYAVAERIGSVPPSVFWPVPKVDSGLVRFSRATPVGLAAAEVSDGGDALRKAVFKVVDAAFAQRRKMLRSALAGLFGSPTAAAQALAGVGVDPQARGEVLGVADFVKVAKALPLPGPGPGPESSGIGLP
ncbi:MAG: 16S rRNA (adenine(1518)-N(6)/adenine(1519)-N(6))-dimethyltransferase RsmA [Propionibacteriaceae bacterium]|jgi:16S rRNA (adenine1518-N6/adenine1519-N6)-dimethyltransferase|nr:16S rRNA (adenine(1518)-N(6)/adenine(1519)-N(6))-dimethyltransferase RsmA [Propionibacteriaceae bacterium]